MKSETKPFTTTLREKAIRYRFTLRVLITLSLCVLAFLSIAIPALDDRVLLSLLMSGVVTGAATLAAGWIWRPSSSFASNVDNAIFATGMVLLALCVSLVFDVGQLIFCAIAFVQIFVSTRAPVISTLRLKNGAWILILQCVILVSVATFYSIRAYERFPDFSAVLQTRAVSVLRSAGQSGVSHLKLSDVSTKDWDEACIYLPSDGSAVNWKVSNWHMEFRKRHVGSVLYLHVDRKVLDLTTTPAKTSWFSPYCYPRNKVLEIKNGSLVLDVQMELSRMNPSESDALKRKLLAIGGSKEQWLELKQLTDLVEFEWSTVCFSMHSAASKHWVLLFENQELRGRKATSIDRSTIDLYQQSPDGDRLSCCYDSKSNLRIVEVGGKRAIAVSCEKQREGAAPESSK